MFTDHTCLICNLKFFEEREGSYELTAETGYVASVLIKAEAATIVTCANGHRTRMGIWDGAHALLFERALQRLIIGATRDAVIDAYTAFEMFLVHVPARARYDREKGASPRALRDELSAATGTTERAMGAAFTAVSLVSGKAPPKLNTGKTTTLRNKAAHAGAYATDEETLNLCLEIERVVHECEALLATQECVNAVTYGNATVTEDLRDAIDRQGEPDLPSMMCTLSTVLDIDRHRSQPPFPVTQRIADYKLMLAQGWAPWRVW